MAMSKFYPATSTFATIGIAFVAAASTVWAIAWSVTAPLRSWADNHIVAPLFDLMLKPSHDVLAQILRPPLAEPVLAMPAARARARAFHERRMQRLNRYERMDGLRTAL